MTLKNAIDFKGFETIHNIVPNIDDQLLCPDVQTEVEHMHAELHRSLEIFQQNLNKLVLNVKHKKIMRLQQMTLHDMFKQ